MIFRIKGFELDVIIEESQVTTIEIIDKQVFRSCIKSIQNNILGFVNNEVVIEENNEIINYTKGIELITDYFNLSVNSKSIIQSLHKKISEDIYYDVELHYKIEEKLMELNNLIRMNFDDYEFGLNMNGEVSIQNLLKMFDLKIDETEYETILNKIYLFIDLIFVFNPNKLLIFINLKEYFNEAEILEIYKYLIYKKIKFLCMESCNDVIIESEIKYSIDDDLIEFGPF